MSLPNRTVLIGKGRRVTIDELLSVAVDSNAVVEWYANNSNKKDGNVASWDATAVEQVITSNAEHLLLLLSNSSTIASLVLLALTVAQEKLCQGCMVLS